MTAACDYTYIWDDNSDDGSQEFYKKFKNIETILSDTNIHAEKGTDILPKKKLLEKLLKEHPDVDWIFWMDGDTLIDGRLIRDNAADLKLTLQEHLNMGTQCLSLGHLNLWRSDTRYRIDSLYHWLNNQGVKAFWRNTGNLHFIDEGGLHQEQWPKGFDETKIKTFKVPSKPSRLKGYAPCLIHRGFATDEQIINKYNFYKRMGQEGWDLERLLDENALLTVKLRKEMLPDFFEIKDDTDPSNKEKILNIYNKNEGN
jgi:hypothetical protein